MSKQKYKDVSLDELLKSKHTAYMFSITCELMALWKPWFPPPYSCSALLCTPIEFPGVFFEFGW